MKCKECGKEFKRHPFFALGKCLDCIMKKEGLDGRRGLLLEV